jgi:hypothetical protein
MNHCDKCGREIPYSACECTRKIEDETIARLLCAFLEECRIWIKSKQDERVYSTVDKYAIALSAYMYGIRKVKKK